MIALHAILPVTWALAPGDAVVVDSARATEVHAPRFVGPLPVDEADSATPAFRWYRAPRVSLTDEAPWHEVDAWDLRRGTVSIVGGVQALGSTQGLPSVRLDQVDAVMGLAWQPRPSRVAFFLAMRVASVAARGVDGPEPEMRRAVGPLAGLRIALPSLVQVLRRWQARFGS